MRDFTGKRYWLVGASEGLGRALAQQMHAAGAEIIVSARSESRLQDLVSELGDRAIAVPCDVSSLTSVTTALDTIGDIDGIVYLAGVYWPMTAQDTDVKDAVKMVDINFTGAMRCVGAVLPRMVERDHGHIVITGSLSAYRGLPGAIGYAASKAGTMSLAESLYMDLRQTGVDVQLANPGFIKTRLTDKNAFDMPFIMEPEAAAKVMLDHMKTRRFNRAFPTVFSWVFRLSQFMPNWMYYRLFEQR